MKYSIYCWFRTDNSDFTKSSVKIELDSPLFEDVRTYLRNTYESGIYDLQYNVYEKH